MASKRVERVNELLRHEIAAALYQVQTTPPLDLARVTVASVDCSPDLRQATVYISVLEDDEQQVKADEVLRELKRNRSAFQSHVARNVILKYTPRLQFKLDRGQDRADRVYRILDSLPPSADEEQSDVGPAT